MPPRSGSPSDLPRVLVVEPRLYEDGASRSTLRLVQRWTRAGVPVTLFVVQRAADGRSAEVPDDVTVIYPRTEGVPPRVLLVLALAKLLPLARRADVVVSGRDVGWGLVMGRVASWVTRRPFVVVVRSEPTQALSHYVSEKLQALTRWSYRSADRVVCISPGLVPAVAALGVDPSRTAVALGGVEVDQILARAPERTSETPAGEVPVVVGVGRLSHQKGFDVLVRAHAAALATGPAHRLQILGDGTDRRALERLVDELGVTGSVDLPGFDDDPLPVIAAADLFALPSRWEGMGQSLAEALLLATPVVAADCVAGPRLLLADGEHGDLVPVDDHEALAGAITAHLNNPARLRAAAEQGKAWATSHLTIERAADDMLEALSVVASPRR